MRFLLFSFILLLGCTHKPSGPLEKEELANLVLKKASIETQKKTELRPCGTMGQMTDKIKRLGVSYFYYQQIEIDEGRRLLVAAINELVNAVNETEEIRPYLSNYPFTSRNIDMRIVAKNPNGSEVPVGKLGLIGIRDDHIYYKSEDSSLHLVKIYEETFEEALAHLDEKR